MNNLATKHAESQALGKDRIVALPVAPANIFHFPDGLPAFEDVHEFVFLCPPDIMPFFIMQSLEPKGLAFVCIDPFLVCPGYSPVISDADIKALNLLRREDVFLFSIVTVKRNMREITANLQGPVVINIQTGIGRQIFCFERNHPVQYPLWDAVSRLQQQQQQQQQEQTQTTPRANGNTAGHILWPIDQTLRRQAEVALTGNKL